MTASTDPPPKKQMNVRLPEDLIAQIDARRAVKDMSRDQWVANALRFALGHHPQAGPLVNSVGRTAPPPHQR